MSGAPRVKSINVADSDARPVLGRAGNKAGSLSTRKPTPKLLRKNEKSSEDAKVCDEKGAQSAMATSPSAKSHSTNVPSVLRRNEQLLRSNLSLNASCSSDASTDSFHSRASTGRLIRSSSLGSRKKVHVSKPKSVVSDGGLDFGLDSPPPLGLQMKKCAWVTPNTDPLYVTFHDEEWGIPIHDDKKLFELLVLSSALSELTWPAILSKRHIFREVFMDFDPFAVSKLNEKKIVAAASSANSLLSELKLRSIIENARQISKVIEEFGSFDKYIWSFVNYKPIISQFRYPRQVPVKTPKADVISKDLVRRGFRSVGPTVIYSFMQVAGITNDHLISCFRFKRCVVTATEMSKDEGEGEGEGEDANNNKMEDKDNVVEDNRVVERMTESELSSAIEELNISTLT